MKRLKTLGVTGLVATSIILGPQGACPAAEASARWLAQVEPRIKAIYETGEFRMRSFHATWLPDGSGYLKLETPAGASGAEIVRYDCASGQRTLVVAGEKLLVPGSSERLRIHGFVCSPTGKRFLLHTDTAGGNDGSDRWLFEPESGDLRPVKAGDGVGFDANPFSPDERRLLGSRGADLVVFDIASGRTIPLTKDGDPDTVDNGRAAWSPDGQWIAYVQSDFSAVPKRAVLVPGDPTYRTFRETRYERIGGPISTLRIGVVGVEGGPTRWIELADQPGTFYLNPLGWAGNSDEVLIDKLSRGRDAREVLLANHRTGAVTKPYAATDPAWVVSWVDMEPGCLEWVRGSNTFVLFSERDGWRRAYVVSRDGSSRTPITPAGSDLIAPGRIDDKNGWFYYYASPTNATQRYLYRARLDGTGTPERLTPPDQPGSHEYVLSPESRWAFHTYSAFDKPPVTDLVQLPEHRRVRVLEDNAAPAARVKPLIERPTEFHKLDIGGGVVMDAWMIKPRDFDRTKKYPVFVFVYGEPAGQTVLDEWYGGQGHSLFHRAVADLGYIVVSIDNRGTPAPKGAAWRRAVYGSLGPLSTEEQAAGLKALARVCPFVDLSRVAIWGWSGGGSNTLNAMFRKPADYHVGIAVVPKPQPQYYNAEYQEIFMRTPEDNPEGYRTCAPINYAEGLRGNLLIIVGTGETNTHVEITEGLVDRLIELGKRFDYFAYPNRDHGLHEGNGTEVHLRMLIIRYLVEHLPPEPR
ncbi:MAG TPA: DPP IV N-terminal domain-containing protein [Verrucomicrobiota bacterium]|nr:DPP IV N-terminal domain-containing protein [Verrucomicrobiota bacterium]